MWSKCGQIWGIQKERPCKVFENQQLTGSFCASGGDSCIGDYRVFMVAIECFVYQQVDRLFRVFK